MTTANRNKLCAGLMVLSILGAITGFAISGHAHAWNNYVGLAASVFIMGTIAYKLIR